MYSAGVPGDEALIQIVDAAMAEAARRSGPWLVCRPGCSQCCIAPFPINPLDARRLRLGLAALDAVDPERAANVRSRARAYVARYADNFPGDPQSGILDRTPQGVERFESFADDEPCPALDPANRTCDLYASRPMSCRIFGPPVRFGDEAVGVCELCYDGASDDQIAACEVEIDPQGIESELLAQYQLTADDTTIVAYCLLG